MFVLLLAICGNLVEAVASPTHNISSRTPISSSTSTISHDYAEAALYAQFYNAWPTLLNLISDTSLRSSCSASIVSNAQEVGSIEQHGGVTNTLNGFKPPCCGLCYINGLSVQVSYWPTSAPESAASTAVVSGLTYTSPSIYVFYSGLGASDQCGPVGSSIDKTVLSFAPGELSTYLGMPAEHGDPYSQVPVAPLDVADFADCSAGVSYLYDTEPSGVVTVPIYQNSTKCVPFVAPPFQVYDLDPAWKSCTVEFGGIYDPPYALQPAQAAITAPSDPSPVVPQPASIPSPVASSTAGPATLPNELTGVWNPSAASPAADPPNQTSSLHTPAQPADPGKSENELGQTNDPTQTLVGPETPVTATPLRTQNINTQQSQPASVGNQNADPSNGLSSTAYISTHQVPTAVIVGGNTITAGGDPVVAGGNTFSIDSGTLHVGPTAVPISAFAYPVGQPQSVQTPQGAFSIINGVTVQPIIPPATTNMPVEVAGIPVSFDPERPGVVVGSKTVLPGAPLVQVAGTLISLGSSDIVVDGSTVPIAQHAGPSPLAATIDSQIIGSGAIYAPSVDGTEPTPEMAATFSGTPLSVDQTGVVVLGSPSITLAENPNPSIFTVGGQTFTAAPQGIPVDGTTLTQGGGAVIISGTPISLAPSGMIIIGSSTAATLSPQSVFTVAGQLFTANPQKFAIGSMSISEGGQGVTISGTPISLGPLGNLFIGTKTAILPKNLPGLGNVIMSAFGPINASATASPSGGAVTGGQPFIGKAARFALCPMWPSVISIGLCVTIVPCL